MRLTLIKCLFILPLFFLGIPVKSNEQPIEITVVSDEWQGFVTKEGQGYYLDILRKTFPSPNYRLKLSILPYSRALYQVQRNQADIVLGIWANEHPISQLSHYPVENDILDAIMRADHNQITGPESFNELRVLSRIGYQVDQLLNQPENYVEHVEIEKMIKMVTSNRADALIDYKSAIMPVLQNLNKRDELHNPLTLIENALTEYVFFGFCALPKCLHLKQKFDKAYLHFYQTGDIEKALLANQQELSALPPLIPASEVLEQ